MRVNMTINDDLLARIDTYAKANFMSRSSVVGFACNQFLVQHELQSLLVDMNRAMRKIADEGNLDDEQLKQIEQWNSMMRLLTMTAAE